LNAAVLCATGALCNANHFKSPKKFLIFCTKSLASTSLVG